MDSRIAQFKKNPLCIVLDDLGHVARGVFVAPASEVSESQVNWVLSHTGGLTFVSISSERADAFLLPTMARPSSGRSSNSGETLKQLVSVEAREGIRTGISAYDRSCTIRILGEQKPDPSRLVKPGHIFPVVARDGGTLVKTSLPEAALDIVKLSGYSDAALFVDILEPDGEFSGGTRLTELAAQYNLPLFSLSDIIRHRLEREQLVYRVAEAKLPTTEAGEVRSIMYRSRIHDGEHLALVKGKIDTNQPVLTRVQSESTCADVFGGAKLPTRAQLQNSLRAKIHVS